MERINLTSFKPQLLLLTLTPPVIMLVLAFLLVFLPPEAILPSVDNQQTKLILIGLATLLIITLIMLLMMLFLNPISNIIKGSRQITQGNGEYKIKPAGHHDLQELAGHLNTLSQNLSRTNQEYSQSVDHYSSDITQIQGQLAQCQAALTSQQDQQELVLSGVTDAVIALDKAGVIQVFNRAAAQITGYASEYALGKDIDKILNVFESDRELEPREYCPEGNAEGIVFRREGLKLIGDNHKKSYVDMIVGRIKHSRSIDLSWIITLSDVTKEQSFQRMKLDFASMAAHELRTPLTTVQGYLSFLQDPNTLQKLSESEQEFINKAALSALRLNKLIENVLAVSKIEQGKLNLTYTKVQMADLIRRLVNEYRGLAQTKDLQLIYTPPAEPIPEIMADSMRIEEVISNFIGNAVKYTNQGSIEVTLAKQGDYIITSVKDTGKGIPNDAIPNLFTKFFRVQSELKSGSKGTGLGLYISKTIIEAHGGKVWAESVLYQGSTFSFSLPIKQAEQKTETPTATPSSEQQGSAPVSNTKTPPLNNTALPDIVQRALEHERTESNDIP